MKRTRILHLAAVLALALGGCSRPDADGILNLVARRRGENLGNLDALLEPYDV